MQKTDSSITLHCLRLCECGDRLKACRSALSDAETARADRFIKPSDGTRFILCRGILRRTLAGFLDCDPSDLVFERNENGKPFLPDSGLEFNVSHSRDRLLIAVTRGRAVGVDIEFRRDGVPMEAIAGRWFAPAEREFFQTLENRRDAFFDIWAKKEAFVKARGEGIFRDLSSFAVPLCGGTAFPTLGKTDGWVFQSLEIDPDYSAALVWQKRVDDEHSPEVVFL